MIYEGLFTVLNFFFSTNPGRWFLLVPFTYEEIDD